MANLRRHGRVALVLILGVALVMVLVRTPHAVAVHAGPAATQSEDAKTRSSEAGTLAQAAIAPKLTTTMTAQTTAADSDKDKNKNCPTKPCPKAR